ncbi:hypothetical protein [Pseudodesulfovibrio sp.]
MMEVEKRGNGKGEKGKMKKEEAPEMGAFLCGGWRGGVGGG